MRRSDRDVEVTDEFRAQRHVLKFAATTLKAADIPFALAGGYAVWARGGRESTHDVDFVIQAKYLDDALAALALEFDIVENSEDWLFKVARGDVVVDIIHRLPGGPVDDALIARADCMSVDSVEMPVMSATDILLGRLLALTEQFCDLSPILVSARSLREQVDWRLIEDEVEGHPFATACVRLLQDLRIVERPGRSDS